MLKANRALPTSAGRSSPVERRAWVILLSAFAIFCTLASATAYAGYRWAVAPAPITVTAQIAAANTALVMRAGLTRAEELVDNTTLKVGDRAIVPEGPPGVAARLQTANGTVGLWPLTRMLVETGGRGLLRLKLEEGQALIELRPGPSLFIAAAPLAQEVELTAPGRYRIRWLSDKTTLTALAERKFVPGFEVATEAGLARIGDAAVEGGKRLLVAGETRPLPNRWLLLRDGDFRQFTDAEYLATLRPEPKARAADTWLLSRQALTEGANARSGLFYLREECDPPNTKPQACRKFVRLARFGGNTKDSIMAITQQIAADVTSYRSVTLEADIRIDFQSLSKGGAEGSECPLFARIDYTNNRAANQEAYFCYWAFDDGKTGNISTQPYIFSQQIPLNSWYRLKIDLRKQLPELRSIQQLHFYSNGHDYNASVGNISLWAEGLDTVAQR